jgi:transposase
LKQAPQKLTISKDEIIVCYAQGEEAVVDCKSCGTSLEFVEVLNLRCSQVHELPPIKLVVHEHQSEEKCCPNCGVVNQGKLPALVNSLVKYEPGLKGLMVYLMEGQLLPSERARELL